MSADALTSRLDKVKETGPGKWIACCPAHDDRSPSLSIRELDDGRVLLHCFADCDIESVLAAVGLDFDALYPERAIGDHVPRERRPFNAGDVLACVATESLVVALAASDIANDKPIDKARILLASSRLSAAADLAGAS